MELNKSTERNPNCFKISEYVQDVILNQWRNDGDGKMSLSFRNKVGFLFTPYIKICRNKISKNQN